MTDEILKEIYKMKQSSEYLTEEEAIAKYKEEYKSVSEGTEKIYNLIWEQVLEKAIYNNEKPIYINIGYGGPLTDIQSKLYNHHYYKNYFKLNNYLVNNIYWFSLEEKGQDVIFFSSIICFIKKDLEDKLEQDGFTEIDFANPLYGIRCVMSREKLNEFIALAEEKYKPEGTLRRNLQN